MMFGTISRKATATLCGGTWKYPISCDYTNVFWSLKHRVMTNNKYILKNLGVLKVMKIEFKSYTQLRLDWKKRKCFCWPLKREKNIITYKAELGWGCEKKKIFKSTKSSQMPNCCWPFRQLRPLLWPSSSAVEDGTPWRVAGGSPEGRPSARAPSVSTLPRCLRFRMRKTSRPTERNRGKRN